SARSPARLASWLPWRSSQPQPRRAPTPRPRSVSPPSSLSPLRAGARREVKQPPPLKVTARNGSTHPDEQRSGRLHPGADRRALCASVRVAIVGRVAHRREPLCSARNLNALGGLTALGGLAGDSFLVPSIALSREDTCPSGICWASGSFEPHQLGITPSLGDLQRSSPARPGVPTTSMMPNPAKPSSKRRRSIGTSRPATKRVPAPASAPSARDLRRIRAPSESSKDRICSSRPRGSTLARSSPSARHRLARRTTTLLAGSSRQGAVEYLTAKERRHEGARRRADVEDGDLDGSGQRP